MPVLYQPYRPSTCRCIRLSVRLNFLTSQQHPHVRLSVSQTFHLLLCPRVQYALSVSMSVSRYVTPVTASGHSNSITIYLPVFIYVKLYPINLVKMQRFPYKISWFFQEVQCSRRHLINIQTKLMLRQVTITSSTSTTCSSRSIRRMG